MRTAGWASLPCGPPPTGRGLSINPTLLCMLGRGQNPEEVKGIVWPVTMRKVRGRAWSSELQVLLDSNAPLLRPRSQRTAL